VGTQGRSGLGKFFLGSTAEELVRQAPCPVLTVGPKASGHVREEFDASAQDFRVAEINISDVLFAIDFTVPCQLVLQRLEDLLPSEVGCWCKPETIVKFGEAAERILQTASERQANVIVLGVKAAKAHMGAVTHLPWSTAHKVIANAPCPVLTVRS
jgi:nucleotide-binding universal stress UspA family protein